MREGKRKKIKRVENGSDGVDVAEPKYVCKK